MSYIIRNYGNTRTLPFKNVSITMVREQAIVTDDVELVNALSGQQGIHITKQSGTVDVLPPPPAEVEPEKPDYQRMSKKELLALCKERGLEIPEKATKKDLIELLEADDAANAAGESDDTAKESDDESDDKVDFKVGDRVTAKIDGDFYTGEIKEISEGKATVSFDDGDELSINLEELELVGSEDEDEE